jgi:hypothetical protein
MVRLRFESADEPGHRSRRIASSLQRAGRIKWLRPEWLCIRFEKTYDDVYRLDGRIEVRAGKDALPYVRYDKLPLIDTAAVVENKRLEHALRAAQAIRTLRDDRRCTPSRTNQGQPSRPRTAVPGTSNSRQFNVQDFEQALRLAGRLRGPFVCADEAATDKETLQTSARCKACAGAACRSGPTNDAPEKVPWLTIPSTAKTAHGQTPASASAAHANTT